MSPFFAKNFLFSDLFLLLVDTISPSFKKSEILIACESNHLDYFLDLKYNFLLIYFYLFV